MDNMPEDLRWLAENVAEWPDRPRVGFCLNWNGASNGRPPDNIYRWEPGVAAGPHRNIFEWQAARQQLADERMNSIARNGNDGLHYDPIMTEEEESEYAPAGQLSKYHVEIRPGVWVDVYDVLTAYRVTNPADAHAIKKMLCPGKRGVKSANQDRREAIISLGRAIELEGDE